MGLTIRDYRPADLDAVTIVWLTSWETTGVMLPGSVGAAELRERLPREIAGGWQVYVAEANGIVVGFLAFAGNSLEQLFVAPDRQNRGLGKQMLDFVKSQRPQGFDLTTAVNARAWRFYEREGLLRAEMFPHPRFGFMKYRYVWVPSQS